MDTELMREALKTLEVYSESATSVVRQELDRLRAEIAAANAARERAEAKCARACQISEEINAESADHILKFIDLNTNQEAYSATRRIGDLLIELQSDNPGQPLLDRLARVEALIGKWRKELGWHAQQCADELEQALKGDSHASIR